MPNDYVNKIQKDSTEYDVKDSRVPDATSSDEGKALLVNSSGVYELGSVGGGGTQLYLHQVSVTNAKVSLGVIWVISSDSTQLTTSDFYMTRLSAHYSGVENRRKVFIIQAMGDTGNVDVYIPYWLSDGYGPGYTYATLAAITVSDAGAVTCAKVFDSNTSVTSDTVYSL